MTIAFAVDDNTETDILWSGQGIAYQDIFSYNGRKRFISFKMPYKLEGTEHF